MASLASGGGIGRRTLGGIDASTSKKPVSTQSNKPMRHRGAKYLSPNPPTHEVYSDSDSDGDDKENIYANGVNLNLVNRGNKTPVGFRLYDGLRSRTASSKQFLENDDDRRRDGFADRRGARVAPTVRGEPRHTRLTRY
jgi:hypothetical protein